MALKNTIEAEVIEQNLPVKATLGFLARIRNDRGFYEAKVALLKVPKWWRSGRLYLLGEHFNEDARRVEDGAWIQFADPAEFITSMWQPRIGDRVMVFTFGDYDYDNGRIFRFATSDETNAKLQEDNVINGPFRSLSGGMA
jgi:hypothetical protein